MKLARLVGAEVRKLRSSWMAPGVMLGAFGFVLFGVVIQLILDGTETADQSGLTLADPDQVRVLLGAASGANLFVVILGVVIMTSEFRHGTITAVFLGEPHRGRVMLAKLVASALVGLAVGVFITVIVLAIALPSLAIKGLDAGLGEAETWRVVLGGTFVLALWCPVGVALGTLVRNQIAAILGAIGWFLIAETVVFAVWPAGSRFLLTGAAAAVSSSGNDDLMAWWGGALVMVAYVVVLGLAAQFTLRRDIK